jgi:hypothetical protein
MRLIRYSAVVLLALLIVAGLVVSMRTFASMGNSQHISPPTPQKGSSSVGVPAITPHINLNNPNLPTFTVSDVTQYVLKYGSPEGPLTQGSHITFEKIVFVTSPEASVLMKGESTGLPNNALVCYVLIHGPFKATGMHLDPVFGIKTAPVVPLTEIVYDARTGKMLVWGVTGISFKH